MSTKLDADIEIVKSGIEHIINSKNKVIPLKDKEAIYFINIDEIEYCEASGTYTKFFLTSDRELLISSPIKFYEESLKDFAFIRVHNSFLVNLNNIIRFERRDGGVIVMKNGSRVPVSKRKKELFVEAINNL